MVPFSISPQTIWIGENIANEKNEAVMKSQNSNLSWLTAIESFIKFQLMHQILLIFVSI